MENYSYFLENKALFGSFPDQIMVNELENLGVRYFVNLTFATEKKIKKYKTNYTVINYPIKDHYIPVNYFKFTKFILNLVNLIMYTAGKDKLIYIHCKGGHGRSGIVVACLLSYIMKINGEESIKLTTKFHNNRTVMKEKWRIRGSPQTKTQKRFVINFTNPFYFLRSYKKGKSEGFSNFSQNKVVIKDLGTFPSSENAYNARLSYNDSVYIKKQEKCMNPYNSRRIRYTIERPSYTDEEKYVIMYNILKQKFEQNKKIRYNLLSTFLRPIINKNNDVFWGIGKDCNGLNNLGLILEELRKYFFLNSVF